MSLFPAIHPNVQVTNPDGTIHQSFHGILSQLIIALQKNLGNEGYKIPQQTTENIATLNNDKSTSALVYNSDTHQLLINLNGEFKTITTS